MNPYLPTIWAFVDESGDSNLAIEKQGASKIFVCAAVLIDNDDLDAAEAEMTELSRTEFNNAEIKSSNIGKNHERRLRILEKIARINFTYLAIVIDKARVFRDSGLQYRRSFYKNINCMLYRRLSRSSVHLEIIADNYGGKCFQDSFKKYMDGQIRQDMFTTWSQEFKDSKDSPLIQLADLIAGSLTYCFDPDKKSAFSSQFREILREKETSINCWPLEIAPPLSVSSDDAVIFDKMILSHNISTAQKFIDLHEDRADEDRNMQAAVLSRLLFHKIHEEEEKGLVADNLISGLLHLRFPELSGRAFRKRIIGPIRDEGIVIAGSTDGYRFVTAIDDVARYVKHDAGIIIPMLARLRKARNAIKQCTGNRFDILGRNQNPVLKKILESLTEAELSNLGMTDYNDEEENIE